MYNIGGFYPWPSREKQISSDPLLASYVEFVIMLGFRQRNLDVTITTETTSAEQVNKEK